MEGIRPDIRGAGRETASDSPDSRQPLDSTQSRPRRLAIDIAKTARATVVTLSGELDVVCADAFKRRFGDAIADEPSHVVLDLRPLTFLDSTGLALLLRVNEMARDEEFALWVVSCEDDPPAKIFRLTGTNKILPLVDRAPDLGVH
jgi:anti-anti-sigma factor